MSDTDIMTTEYLRDHYEESEQSVWWSLLRSGPKRMILDLDMFIHNVFKYISLRFFKKRRA